ncbi:MAG TPA: metallophosphoesterase [Candidatus Deferrimicrobium sp.]|nr:metallophosphoesterase [Candidatus Deferrimicrobium sp.]
MRRERVLGATAIVVGALAGAAAVEGFLREPFQLDVTRLTIVSPRLPAGFDGLKIAQLSDLHLHHISRAYRTAIDVIRRERPHLVVITGDLVDCPEETSACIAFLSELRAAARVPVVVVPGNWDHRAFPTKRSIAAWHKRFQAETGIRVLVNQNVVLRRGGDHMWLVGTDDPYFGHADLDASFKGVPDTAFALVLTHAPEAFEELAERPAARLVLAGHTHGGQVRLPFIGAVRVPSRYGTRFAHGLFKLGDTLFYVNAGMGMSHLPIRFLCRPELTVLTLKKPVTVARPL